ncbi:3-oxoacyl-[acyl-carrier-protein] synthase III C-terminal domain-containing protein [Sorangium sp. So ce134]
MIAARILGTGSALPGRRRTTAEIVAEALPGRDPAEIALRTGIATRYWMEPGATAASLGAAALARALEAAGCAARDLKRLIFVSSTGGDALVPATANAVLEAMGLDDTCDAFDLNNACTGFLSAFDVAARSVATGLDKVAVVVAETFSPYLPPDRPRPYLIFGDAAAAVVLGPARPGEGVLATHLANSAALRDKVTMAHPGRTGARPFIDFAASYDELTESALAAVAASTRRVLDDAGLSLDEIEWFVPHQPNGRMLERILKALRVPADRAVPVVDEIGSVAAASVPVSLDRLLRTRAVRPGDRILMAAVGAGTAHGAALYRVAP